MKTTGIVKLTHPGVVVGNYTSGAPPDGSKVLNLGQQGDVARTLYDINNDQLRSTDLLTAGATANPIAQNVVLVKAQYGIDCLGNGVISWTMEGFDKNALQALGGKAGVATFTARDQVPAFKAG